MQDYSKLYSSRIRLSRPSGRLKQVKRLLLSGLPPEIIVLLVAAVIFPKEIINLIKR